MTARDRPHAVPHLSLQRFVGLANAGHLSCRRFLRCETITRASVLDFTGTTLTPVGVIVTTK
jgi:hypothetical protein